MDGISLTGVYKFDKSKSTSQKAIMELMDREKWQINLCDEADETFKLYHMTMKNAKGQSVHCFEMDVVMSVDLKRIGSVIGPIAKFVNNALNLPYEKIHFTHKLIANGKSVEHKDDEKRFGDSESVTTWEQGVTRNNKPCEGLMIRWKQKNGLLKVFHTINEDGLFEVQMEFVTIDKHKKEIKAKSVKTYMRHALSPAERAYLVSLPHYRSEQ